MRPHQIGALIFGLIVVSVLLSRLTQSSVDDADTSRETEAVEGTH